MADGHTTPTRSRPKTGSHPCGCSDGPCTCDCGCDDGCGLECLVQPRFFHGQLLTDQDLRQLLTWTKERLRLAHYRDGWGVVCGLDIRCDPKYHDRVIVSPGYAVSCCGDDIVVCDDAIVDLCEACRVEPDPCADPYNPRKPAGDGTNSSNGDAQPHLHLDWTGEADANGGETQDIRTVDLYLSYVEVPSEPVAALGRGSCRTTTDCEYSRTREAYRIDWRPAALCDDPVSAAAHRWHARYDACLEVATRFREYYLRLASGDAPDPRIINPQLRRWLLRWIEDHPLRQFCGIRDIINGVPDDGEGAQFERLLGRVLFYLVQDCRNAMLQCDCDTCGDNDAVPIGRVYLEITNQNGKRGCHVRWIDTFPPYRRPLGRDCWPAPTGWINVGRAIWQRPDDACTILTSMGVRISAQAKLDTFGFDYFERQEQLFVRCGETVIVGYIDAPFCGRRVVAVSGVDRFDGDIVSPERLRAADPAPAVAAEAVGVPEVAAPAKTRTRSRNRRNQASNEETGEPQ